MTTPTQLNQEEKRIKIAEACKWSIHQVTSSGFRDVLRLPPGVCLTESSAWEYAGTTLPDYFGSLDACHEMEDHLGDLSGKYETAIQDRMGRFFWKTPADIRAEAFGLTLGLWSNA